MKDYNSLSDFEINKAVAIAIRPEIKDWRCYDISSRACFVINDHTPKRVQFGFSFISDPSDAWPIIIENEISLLSSWNEEGIWGASPPHPGKSYEDKNPLRAAMIVFLMMQEGEDANSR